MDPHGHNHRHHRREEEPPYPPPGPYDQPPPPPHFSNFGGGPPDPYAPPPPHIPAPSPYTADYYPQPPPNHHHTSHHRREEQPHYPPPPNPYGQYDQPPPPPPHASNFGGGPPDSYPPPPPHAPAPPPYTADYYDQPPPPPQSTAHHVSHEISHHSPHVPPIINHHHTGHTKVTESYLDNKPTVRVYSKAKTDYSLTIRDGRVILAPSDPSDPYQHWIKDEKFSIRVKDEQGYPSFALVNKATGEAMKHSVGATHPVQLTKYNPDKLDESVLWTQSKDLGDGYRTVRMVNNIKLNVDALNGDQNHGGVRDGTKIVLWEWKKGDNQRWTMVRY